MYDEGWQDMLNNFRACKKPDRWKYTFMQESGEYNKVWGSKGVFYLKHKNVVKMILSIFLCAKLVQEG